VIAPPPSAEAISALGDVDLPASPWLSAGFDDVFPLPLVKPLLLVRVRAWLRIREETSGRFRALVEESTIGFYRTTPDGRILYANPALVHMLGFSSLEELKTRNLEEEGFGPETPRSLFKEKLEKEGRVRGFESVWIRKDGSRLWVRESAQAVRDEFGRILYYEGTVEDITKEVEAREAYFTVVENSLQGMAILQEGRVVFGNPALEKLSGRSLEELMAMSAEEILGMVHPEDRPWVAENIRRRLAGEAVPALTEFRFKHPLGTGFGPAYPLPRSASDPRRLSRHHRGKEAQRAAGGGERFRKEARPFPLARGGGQGRGGGSPRHRRRG